MGKNAYPTTAELEALLTAAGVSLGTLDTSGAVLVGRHEVERRCGRTFLAASGTHVFSPPVGTGYLDFGADLAALTSVQYQPEGSSAETWTEHTDFWLLPQNAGQEGEPYTGLQLNRRWTGPLPPALHRALRVTGSWGYGSTIPEDVWQAMLFAAALTLLPAYGLNISGGKTYAENGSVADSWGREPTYGVRLNWSLFVADTIARYRRVRT